MASVVCSTCCAPFAGAAELALHVGSMHPVVAPTAAVVEVPRRGGRSAAAVAPSPFECPHAPCGRSYTTVRRRRGGARHDFVSGEGGGGCPWAGGGGAAAQASNLRAHVRACHLGFGFKCALPGCGGLVFSFKHSLRAHVQRDHGVAMRGDVQATQRAGDVSVDGAPSRGVL